MWPTEGHGTGSTGAWSSMSRRARVVALTVIGVLAALTAGATGLTIRFGQPTSPIYGPGPAAPAALWTWDGSAYASIPVTGPTSNDADMAYDRSHRLLLLWDHGCAQLVMGFTGGCPSPVNQTWTWDGSRWASHSPRSSPEEVGPGAMIYDARLGEALYVNGAGEAWAWDGNDWGRLSMPGGPPVPRPGSAADASAFAAGYDEARDRLVFALSSGTWAWDGARWTAIGGGIDASEQSDAHIVYDRAHDQLVYVGRRSTLTWDGGGWRAHEEPPLTAGSVAYDPTRRDVMFVRKDSSSCDRTACSTTTWTWDSNSWTRLPVGGGPRLPLTRSGAFTPPMAYDEAGRVLVLFTSGS
jgi:hypothetical protein